MKNIIFALFIFCSLSFALVLKPYKEIKVDGSVDDITLYEDELLIGTSKGELYRYLFKDENLTKVTTIPKIKDFTGETIDARIFSVDDFKNSYLFVSDSGVGGYSDLWLFELNSTKHLIGSKDKLPIIKARFVDKDHALLGLLSSEAILYDLKNKKIDFRIQADESKFSDFALNEDRTKAAFSSESGIITIIDLKSKKILKKLKGVNRDNVYSVAFVKDVVTGGGKDRRGSIYDLKSGKRDFIQGDFFIYVTALDKEAKRVAFVLHEISDISIFDLGTKSKLYILKGQKGSVNHILFKDRDWLISSSDSDQILIWKLK